MRRAWTKTLKAQVEDWAAHLVFGVAGDRSSRKIRESLKQEFSSTLRY